MPIGPDTGVRAGGGFSPDGEYVWFTSAESGRTEVYVEALPPAFGKWQISIHGGSQPRWRGDSRELFFVALDGKLMAADIRTGPSVTEERDGDPEAEARVTIAYSNAGRDRVAKDERASVALVSDRIRRRFDVPTPLPNAKRLQSSGRKRIGVLPVQDTKRAHWTSERRRPFLS